MADQTLARVVNERRILTQLRQHTTLSRAELARRLSLTPATITNLVENLRRDGLVVEDHTGPLKEPRGLGRPSVGLALNRHSGYFLGVEIGVGIMRFALVDLALQVVHSATTATAPDISPAQAVDAIAAHLYALDRNQSFKGRIRAVCLTVPGLVRSDGYVVHLPILGWKGVNLLDLGRARLSLPMLVENNAHAAAFGEVYTQPLLDTDCIVYLKPGMGCGGAVIVQGRLLRGTAGTAAELGHLRITAEGPRCSCGQRGCLETWVTLPALARAYDPSRAWSGAALRSLPEHVVERAAAGDERARLAAASIARHLASGLVLLVNSFNPSAVLLGGSMRPVVEFGLAALREDVAAGIVPGMTMPQIRLSTLGDFECAIGVAAVAHHQAFDVSTIEVTPEHHARNRDERARRQPRPGPGAMTVSLDTEEGSISAR